eukprot:m.35975 g.35975  ORF g.35975 m.35975 type:complete len:432 (+) comp15874_c0_seq1:149-1444(+)
MEEKLAEARAVLEQLAADPNMHSLIVQTARNVQFHPSAENPTTPVKDDPDQAIPKDEFEDASNDEANDESPSSAPSSPLSYPDQDLEGVTDNGERELMVFLEACGKLPPRENRVMWELYNSDYDVPTLIDLCETLAENPDQELAFEPYYETLSLIAAEDLELEQDNEVDQDEEDEDAENPLVLNEEVHHLATRHHALLAMVQSMNIPLPDDYEPPPQEIDIEFEEDLPSALAEILPKLEHQNDTLETLICCHVAEVCGAFQQVVHQYEILTHENIREYLSANNMTHLLHRAQVYDNFEWTSEDLDDVAALTQKVAGEISRQQEKCGWTNEEVLQAQRDASALTEIGQEMRKTDLIMPRDCFARLTQELIQEFKTDCTITPEGLEALQTATEDYLVEMFKRCLASAIHAQRDCVMMRDFTFVKGMMNAENWR